MAANGGARGVEEVVTNDERALLVRALRALRSEHLCATVQDDGSCGGCHVSSVLSHPLAVEILKEADRG